MKKYLKTGYAAVAVMFLFSIFAVSETKAQGQGVLNEILKRMDEHQKALKSLKANVVMDKYNPQIDTHDVFEGVSQYVAVSGRDARVRIDWSKPAETLAYADGQYIIYRPRNNEAITGTKQKATGTGTAGGVFSFMNMSKEQLRANYSVKYLGKETVSGGADTWHLELTPKTAQSFKLVEIWVDGNGMPLQIKTVEKNNDSTTILLSNLQKNISIDGKQFKLALPKGTKVIKS